MDKAKATVSNFMSKAGHHDTTVHEKVAPAVTNETVTKHRHEEATTAIDREVHQDHYHTSVQPVKDREILPESHQHNVLPVESREHHHGDKAALEAKLEQEKAQFSSTRQTGSTEHSHSVAPVVAGEHVHHHVHETIQPVIQKETIQPSVVHTTVPIHEVHHNEAKHHTSSALPAVSMADFKHQGGTLSGREERYDGFEGEPKAVGSALGSGSTGTTGTTGLGSGTTGTGTTDSGLTGHHSTGTGTTGSGLTGHHGTGTGTTGTGYDDTTGTTGTGYDDTTGTTGKKPGLMDRMNPMKDADHDGKKGFME